MANNSSTRNHVVSRRIGDGSILLDTSSGRYFSLNQIGTRVWEMTCSGASRSEIIDALMEEFDVDSETATTDVCALADKLRSLNLDPK